MIYLLQAIWYSCAIVVHVLWKPVLIIAGIYTVLTILGIIIAKIRGK